MSFMLEGNISFDQLLLERFLINRFQKPAAELAMDFHCCPDDGMCPRVSFVLAYHGLASQFTPGSSSL